jgi:hypothetical protein
MKKTIKKNISIILISLLICSLFLNIIFIFKLNIANNKLVDMRTKENEQWHKFSEDLSKCSDCNSRIYDCEFEHRLEIINLQLKLNECNKLK